mmetsp:Transcript_16701/g.31971  ORF Transcript_16701/g.31971 Transcript_16701/m.31971 type:complete len:268 (+) Transcript_16701:570-1373(+)
MRVLFLDMDGVVVIRRPGIAESKLVENLRYVVEQTDAKIVLSTDWRRTPAARAEVRRILQAHGGMDFIGWTATNTSITMNHRPMEILNWVRERNKKVKQEGWSEEELVEAFVAVDDRALLQERGGDRLHGHFVQTHPNRGLTKAVADEMIRLFANKWVDKSKVPETPPTPTTAASASRSPGVVGSATTARTLMRVNPTAGQRAILDARKVAPGMGRSTIGSRPMVVSGTTVGSRLTASQRLISSGPHALATGSGVRGASAIRASTNY